jgi:rubredoxin
VVFSANGLGYNHLAFYKPFNVEKHMAEFRKYKCKTCGHIYDEQLGDPRQGIAPGTRWEDVPEDWGCPKCGAIKSMFRLMS